MKNTNFAFFGTPEYSVYTLEALFNRGYIPSLIITAPDRPVGRHFTLTPPRVKVWADSHSIPTIQPVKINEEIIKEIQSYNTDYFVVSAYGKILPKALLGIPEHGTLNVHPSLLPLYRGPAPEKDPVLAGDKETGVSIILLDEMVDHGPILIQEKIPLTETETTPELAEKLFTRGGEILADIIPQWIAKEIIPKEQDHAKATFTKKIKKEDGLLHLNGSAIQNYNKYRAFYAWPGTYFFVNKNGKETRVKIKKARYENNSFIIERVVPEGKKEIDYSIFLQSIN
jgi:methionyl-tRNA formyltransferase